MLNSFLTFIVKLDQIEKNAVSFGIVIVFIWIAALKFFSYEADGIFPFVANSPLLSIFYQHPEDYKKYVNKESELIDSNHQWHQSNETYVFSRVLVVFIILLSVLLALHKVVPILSMIASILVVIISLGTLSFLITSPGSWVPI